VEKTQIFPIAVDQIDKSGVVDCVGFAVLGCDLGVIDLVGEVEPTDVVRRSGQPNEARVKGRHVVGEMLDSIALRIDRDEDRLTYAVIPSMSARGSAPRMRESPVEEESIQRVVD
jgi:hypothetical protein